MDVEIWSDIACPWCYVGKRRFEQALARFDGRDEVKVTWRSFELDPNAPPEGWQGNAQYRDADTTIISLNSFVPEGMYLPVEEADNTVCHEMMHAYTRIHDAYDSDVSGSCVWGELLAPGRGYHRRG